MSTTTQNVSQGDEEDKRPASSTVQRALINSAAIVFIGTLLSRILGLVRASVISWQFGQNGKTDVYNAAFTIPDVIFYLIAGGALSSSFIPVFTEYMEKKSEKEAWRLFSIIVTMTIIVVGSLILLGNLFLTPLVHAFYPKSSPEFIRQTVSLTRILLPLQICFFLGGLMMGALQVKKNSYGQAFGPVIYNLGIICGGVFLGRRFGIAGLCWGAVGGAVLGNLVLQWVLIRRVGGNYRPLALFKYWGHPGARKVWNLMWPILLGLSLPSVCPIVNKSFASALGDGAISALTNANFLMQVPLGIFAQAFSIAILPMMAQQSAQDDLAGLRNTLNFGIRFILFLTIPSSIFMMTLALPIVQTLFQHGAYKAEDTHFAALLLIFYSIGLFAWSAQAIIARGFYSMQDSRTPVIVGTSVTVLFIIGNLVALKVFGNSPENGLRTACALAFVTSWAAILNTGILLMLLNRKLKGIHAKQLALSAGKTLLASIALGIVCYVVSLALYSRLSHFGTFLQGFGTLTICGVLGILAYLACAFAMRMEETEMLLNMLRKVSKRSRLTGNQASL